MKNKIWGPEKAFTCLSILGRKSFLGNNRTKIRRRRIAKLIFREKRPLDGYTTYTIRRSKPYHTWDASLMPEDSKHYKYGRNKMKTKSEAIIQSCWRWKDE